MSDNFYDIFDHGMDLELRNFVRVFLCLVANYGKSRIEKEEEKKYLLDLPPNSHYFCLFGFFWGGRLRIYYGIFCNYDKE